MESMGLNWNFQRGGRFRPTSIGGVYEYCLEQHIVHAGFEPRGGGGIPIWKGRGCSSEILN